MIMSKSEPRSRDPSLFFNQINKKYEMWPARSRERGLKIPPRCLAFLYDPALPETAWRELLSRRPGFGRHAEPRRRALRKERHLPLRPFARRRDGHRHQQA